MTLFRSALDQLFLSSNIISFVQNDLKLPAMHSAAAAALSENNVMGL